MAIEYISLMHDKIQKFDISYAEDLIADGWIRRSAHPSGELFIYNYTEKTVYEKFWNQYTLQCRGLITDIEGNIIARPFPKIFNVEELDSLPNEPYDVYEKLDGSLGILYFYKDKPYIATRGSFTGEQAVVANEMLQKLDTSAFRKGLTYLFEIIYPENRIVVNYGDERSLRLIGLVVTATGEDISDLDVQGYGRFPHITALNPSVPALQALNIQNKEGFVLRFKSGIRVKVKFKDYVMLHSIITEMTARKVWEAVKSNKSFDEFIKNIPDEIFGWIKAKENYFKEQYALIESKAKADLNKIMGEYHENRKSVAMMIKNCDNPHVLFRMFDDKDYSECIWKTLEPEHELPILDTQKNT
jgi:RNA ligase